MAKNAAPVRRPQAGIEAARAALAEGDYRAARRHAAEVLADPNAASAHAEARRIDQATRIDRSALVAGALVLAVLVVLFWWALSRAQGTP